MIGSTFGNLLVIKPINNTYSHIRDMLFLCLCSCGVEVIKSRRCLLSKTTQHISCNKCRSRKGIRFSDVGKLYPDGYGQYSGSYINTMINVRKNKAKKRNLNWELSATEVAEFFLSNCFYCGKKSLPPNIINGIDRVNNSIGYIYTNCVACCKYCNAGKYNRTLYSFIEWIKNLHYVDVPPTINDIKFNYNSHLDINIFDNKNRVRFLKIISEKKIKAKSNILWNLSPIDVAKCIISKCTYCGIIPDINKNTNLYIFNGIDRINSDIGYITNNCTPCCKYCNWAKNTLSIIDFNNHILNLKNRISIIERLANGEEQNVRNKITANK